MARITNTAEMTNTELRAALDEAVDWSNWHFEAEDWNLSEQWHLRAVELHEAVERRSRQ